MNNKLLFLVPVFSVLLFACNQKQSSNDSSRDCSCTCTCDQSSESTSESTEESDEGSTSEQSTSFVVKFHVDTTKLDSWNPPASGYFLHAWGTNGGFDTWGKAIMNMDSAHKYSYSYNINNGEAITGVIFALKQGSSDKQTVDINCNISSAGEYQIKYNDADWPDGKMSASLELIQQ